MPITATAERAEFIVELSRLALAAPDVPSAIIPILDSLVNRTAAEGAAYFQLRELAFFARAASGVMPEGPVMTAILTHGLPGDSPLMEALRSSSVPLFFNDTLASPEAAGFPELGVCSLAAAPVYDVQGRMLGAFLMHTFEPHEWADSEVDLFAAVAGVLANLAARLVAEEQADQAREGALRALGLALEFRDDETKGHTDRVTDLSLRIAAALGLDDAAMTAIKWGAYLHDVGKLSIPDSILRKPGTLDAREWGVMRKHPAIGHSFASQLGFLPRQSLDIILFHHEKWDGSGYPEGRSGQNIPLSARLFALCDVFDALTSDRPYKAAWPRNHARGVIADSAGSHFDPELVRVFLEVV